jgi:SAM-dependent methyltransferase
VDPNERYIEIARARGRHGVRFERADVGTKGGLDGVSSSSADLVFMSDALLFYFYPAAPGQDADLDELLASVRRILAPTGTFVSMEPHPVFWLAPWLGQVDLPFTIVAEYTHKNYGVTPTLTTFVKALTAHGLAVVDLTEVTSGEIRPNDRGTHFAAEFPLWHVVEARIM